MSKINQPPSPTPGHHVHSTAHAAHVMQPVVDFLLRQDAIMRGVATQAQLDLVLAALTKLPEYQRYIAGGGTPIGAQELKLLNERVNRGNFNADSTEKASEREAKRLQSKATGGHPVIMELSDNLDREREHRSQLLAVPLKEIDDELTSINTEFPNGLFTARYAGEREQPASRAMLCTDFIQAEAELAA